MTGRETPRPDLPDVPPEVTTHATPEDAAEQRVTPTRDAPPPAAPEVPLEAPAADTLEQATDAAPAGHRVPRDVPPDVPEADAVEQAHVEPLDEDAYRE